MCCFCSPDVKLNSNIANFRNSNFYKIKVYILKTLSTVASYPELRAVVRSPVNLLLSELMLSHKYPLMRTDNAFRSLIYELLVHWADAAELVHRHRWLESTEKYDIPRKRM